MAWTVWVLLLGLPVGLMVEGEIERGDLEAKIKKARWELGKVKSNCAYSLTSGTWVMFDSV